MNKGSATPAPILIAGAYIGLLLGGLVAWFPVRLLYCAASYSPDCGEIVLMAWPCYCFIAPLTGAAVANFLYRRKHPP